MLKINNILKLYILVLLHQKPKHGYELIKELSIKMNKRISASNIYPFLSTLKKAKYIKINRVGGREKKVYYLTNDGKRFIKNTLKRLDEIINLGIKPNLKACYYCGCKIYSGGYKKKINGRYLFFCCKNCAHTHKKY
ncbi:MAG: PadR family transcriptional regulator [Nanoarchaeota archaeon]